MALFQRKTALQKEWEQLEKREKRFLEHHMQKKENFLTVKLETVVPANLQSTLNTAFYKAFQLVFEKGTDLIEKTYRSEERKKNFQIHDYTVDLKRDRKNLRAFGKAASSAGTGNVLLSGAAGVGMGLFGVGIPDIPVFTALLLKNIYEISLSYGFDYKLPQERQLILMLIEAAVSGGKRLLELDEQINGFIEMERFPIQQDRESLLRSCADVLSQELLYMKFVQGIPVIGAVGGACDAIIMSKVGDYAKLKYQRRLLKKKML